MQSVTKQDRGKMIKAPGFLTAIWSFIALLVFCNKVRITVTAALFLLSSLCLAAQDIQFRASAPPVAEVGQQFRLTYSLNAQGNDLRLPHLGIFRLLSGPSTSSSRSVQIIDGEMTQTVSVTYTYVLLATEEGSFTIGPASIGVDQERYESNPVTIEVTAGSEGRSALPSRPGDQAAPGATAAPAGEDIFVRLITDKQDVYQGEGIVVTVKLYSKLDLTGIENVRFPPFSGFFQQDIETPQLRTLDREVVDGEIYGTGILRRFIIFPQRSGEITIEPFEMDAMVRQRTGRRGSLFDDFFGGFETSRIPVRSSPVNLYVKPLPPQGPDGYTGAVGDFSLDVDIDSRETGTNEAVSLRVTLSGNGNLRLMGRPSIDFPPTFEVYDPSVRENISSSIRGQEGSITYEYLMIPRSEGNYRIPPVRFSYFSPRSATYQTLRSDELNLTVHRTDTPEGGPPVTGFAREDLRVIGRDIRFIRTGTIIFREAGYDPFGTFSLYLWFLVPLALFAALVVIRRKSIADRADLARMKNRRARKMAGRRLKIAGRYMKQNEQQRFFEEVLRAHWGYLSDKLLIPVADLNGGKAKSELLERGVPAGLVDRLMTVIDQCEYARYAPPSSLPGMDEIYNDSVRAISEIEQKIRK